MATDMATSLTWCPICWRGAFVDGKRSRLKRSQYLSPCSTHSLGIRVYTDADSETVACSTQVVAVNDSSCA